MTDPIADMLTRIRNAFMAGHDHVEIPGSIIKGEIARVLAEEGYVESYRISEEGVKKNITIRLKYGPDGKAAHRRDKESKQAIKKGLRGQG